MARERSSPRSLGLTAVPAAVAATLIPVEPPSGRRTASARRNASNRAVPEAMAHRDALIGLSRAANSRRQALPN